MHAPLPRRVGLLVALALLPRLAHAQAQAEPGGLDAHGFVLAAYDGDPRDPLTVQRPGRFKQGEWFVGGVVEFADRPLQFTYDTATGPQTAVVLDDLLAFNLSGGAAVHDRLRLDVAMPVYFTSASWDERQGVGVGDLRAAAMVSLVRPSDYWNGGGLGVGLVPYLDLPSGAEGRYLGASGVAGGAKAAVTYEIAMLTLSGDVGMQFNPAVDVGNLNGSDAVVAGAGIGVLFAPNVGLNLEAHLAPPLKASVEPGTNAPAELLGSFRARLPSGPHLTAGGALGLNDGAGAAAWRAFLGLGFGVITPPRPKDADLDGLLDEDDACPTQPETVNRWKDEDGCPDQLAEVRLVVKHGAAEVSGALVTLKSEEGSRKGVSENLNAPWEAMPGTQWEAWASWGSCMTGAASLVAAEGPNVLQLDLMVGRTARVRYRVVDEEGRAIPGTEVHFTSEARECVPDLLLLEAGTGQQDVGAGDHVLYVEAPGFGIYRQPLAIEEGRDQVVEVVLHPTKVRLEARQIVILDKVYFEFNKAIIKPESYGLLDEVATTILANPQLRKVQVSGHTDDKGNDAYNMRLSDDRAKAVRDYLVGRGVAAERLNAVGFGETLPVMPNTTEANRSFNRRVEFNILEQAPVEK